MKHAKLIIIIMAAVSVLLPASCSVYARGGGGHGGHGGGGWGGGGRGAGHEGERGGGRSGYDHDRRNDYNNNGYHHGDWGWQASDGAVAGLVAADAVIDDDSDESSTVILVK